MEPSDFVLITGPEWIEIENASTLVQQYGMDHLAMQNHIATRDFALVNQWGEDTGLLPPGMQVVDGRMFDVGGGAPGEVTIRLWLIFAPAN